MNILESSIDALLGLYVIDRFGGQAYPEIGVVSRKVNADTYLVRYENKLCLLTLDQLRDKTLYPSKEAAETVIQAQNEYIESLLAENV